MSGAAFAALTEGCNEKFIITVAAGPFGSYGYSVPGGAGSISDTTFRGFTFSSVLFSSGSSAFWIALTGDVAQSYIKKVCIEDTSGLVRTYTSATVNYDSIAVTGNGTSLWEWTTSGVWQASDVAAQRTLVIYF
jgi:hypothetical protein